MEGERRRRASPAREAWETLFDLVFSEPVHERLHEVSAAASLTPGLMKALLELEPGQAFPMRTLSDKWHCDASYVTSLIDGLEERGVVERLVSAVDRRAKMVLLTPAGEQLRDKLIEQLREPPPFFLTLSAREQRLLRDLLQKVLSAAGERPSESGREPPQRRRHRAGGPPGRRAAMQTR